MTSRYPSAACMCGMNVPIVPMTPPAMYVGSKPPIGKIPLMNGSTNATRVPSVSACLPVRVTTPSSRPNVATARPSATDTASRPSSESPSSQLEQPGPDPEQEHDLEHDDDRRRRPSARR